MKIKASDSRKVWIEDYDCNNRVIGLVELEVGGNEFIDSNLAVQLKYSPNDIWAFDGIISKEGFQFRNYAMKGYDTNCTIEELARKSKDISFLLNDPRILSEIEKRLNQEGEIK